jgi:hypothetical protein
MRYYFTQWKEVSNQRTLVKEMHEEGPIREEVFEARIQLQNHKDFLTSEGYDPKQIQEAIKAEKDR